VVVLPGLEVRRLEEKELGEEGEEGGREFEKKEKDRGREERRGEIDRKKSG
jgi:hypothetical protein